MEAADPSSLRSLELTRQREEKAVIISIYFLSVHLQSRKDSHQPSTKHGSMHLTANMKR